MERSLGEEDGIIVELEVEENAGEVEEEVGVVGRDVQGSAEALDGVLCVALDTPVVPHVVQDSEGVRRLEWGRGQLLWLV